MNRSPHAPTPTKKKLADVQADHSRRLKILEDIVGPPPPPGSPTQFHRLLQQMNEMQAELTLISSQVTRMGLVEREIAKLRAELRGGQFGQTQPG
jgi:hypothetical protein